MVVHLVYIPSFLFNSTLSFLPFLCLSDTLSNPPRSLNPVREEGRANKLYHTSKRATHSLMTSDHHQHPYHLPPSSSTSISSSLPLLPPLSLPLSLSSTSAAALTNALLAQHYARSRQQQDNMNNNNNNTTSSSNATNWRPQYMPFNPSLSSMMSNNKNTSHHHHHSVNNNATGGGSATTSTTSTAQNHTSDDFQETKSITLEWKLSNLKNIFSSSQGDQKSKCIKSG